ncbi:response regulator transcription factor [Aerococcaceae bacterium NML191292]|nr:response regulator transcription factor [Aerococcaceae bacterium NML191292]MCW6679859.1 response regulator transcription factor [Aerococcaceae bacterium NML130460]
MVEIISIMVAEDIDLLREDLVEAINEQADLEVIADVATGKEIVEKVRELAPDIVLMDIEMETINAGIKATETINQLNEKTKVIYFTAHENRETVLTAMATGAVDYVVKGESYEEVFRHIRAVMNGRPLMQGVANELILQEYKRLKQSEKGLLYFINNISKLTNTEREIIKLLLQEHRVAEIAKIRSVELVTVKTQITGLLKKFGVSRTLEIVTIIRELNLEHLF